MLEEMYADAVKLGINSVNYWDYTWEELMLELESLRFQQETKLKEHALFDYRLAQLISFAVNDPKNIPTKEEAYPILEVPEEVKRLEEQKQNEQNLLAFFQQLKLDDKGGGSE
ncbi:hypothetical protein SAMN02745116_02620 [Pilibacter termitis]|uniref:Uncharacterized protein n=2 Tax=Pilibacter termitis TaxID=263852 RepID=A0A1T4RIS4_9ENTE|nr:hypothetical protein SAMN02745116_02620 [Pilibacter termitis]